MGRVRPRRAKELSCRIAERFSTMARLQAMMKDLQLCVAGIQPAAIAPALAAFARAELANSIASGEGSPDYDKFVNGNPGADESTVVPPGPIVYVFNWWADVVTYALQTLIDLSPELSGDYKHSWIIMVDGQPVADPKDISVASVVQITNDSDYSRSIDVGHKKYRLGHNIIETGRQKVNSVYGNLITARRELIQLPGGYILKGHFRRGFRKYARRKLRPDVAAGSAMTYPCLTLSMKG